MHIRLNNFAWIAATIVVAVAFYFQVNADKKFTSDRLETNTSSNPYQASFHIQKRSSAPLQKKLPAPYPPEPSVIKTQQGKPNSPDERISSETKPSEQSLPPAIEIKAPEKISDADAKKVIPYPFNLALGIFQENDRERYKEFSDAQLSDDWDITMQGQLVDAIYSHPLANALTIDSVSCKAHICELRLLATNTKTWPLVYADLRQQPWWAFGNNYSTYEFGIKQDTQIKTVYFILLYKI